MSTENDDQPDFYDLTKQANDRFREEHDDAEAIFEGTIGFHAFFNADADDPTRGIHTAIYQGIFNELQEVSVDADIVRINHDEVTPETARAELINQLHEFTYLPENLVEAIGDAAENRVRENLEAMEDEA
jgi:hypothetical protein